MMYNFPEGKVLKVEWTDHFKIVAATKVSWTLAECIKEVDNVQPLLSVGMYVGETKDWLFMALTLDKSDDNNENSYWEPMFIYKKCIVSIK